MAVAVALLLLSITPTVAMAASVSLHAAHVGAQSETFNAESDDGGLSSPVVWHFVLNGLDRGTAAAQLTVTFKGAGTLSATGRPVGKGSTQHFYVGTSAHDVLRSATANVESTDHGRLVLSHVVVRVTPPADDPPADDPPADDPPADDPPADDPPADDPPADDPRADDPPADDPPADDPPADNPPANEPPANNPPADDPPVNDPPAGDPPATDAPAADPPADEPFLPFTESDEDQDAEEFLPYTGADVTPALALVVFFTVLGLGLRMSAVPAVERVSSVRR